MRRFESFASRIRLIWKGSGCFSITHGRVALSTMIFEPNTAAWGDTGRSGAMKLLNFLVESFVGAFGITRPKPEQQRTVALALGGFLLVFFSAFISLIVWMIFGVQR
jgi:hypothetical protein